MNILTERNKNFLVRYKWIIIPGVPLLFFALMSFFIFTPESNNSLNIDLTGTPIIQQPTISNENKVSDEEREGNEESVEERPGLQKKESLPDGTTRYTFESPDSERPHLIISKGTHDILFQRTLTLPNFPVKISDYTNSYGNPKWIFKGSEFYGPDAQSYIYPELGFAFIGNSKTGDVLEQHTFPPMRVEDYVSKYGDDIPSQP